MQTRAGFVVGKIIRGITLLLGLSVLSFTLLKLSPIDPVYALVHNDSTLSKEQYDIIATQWGLNEPPVQQYLLWLKNVVTGDLGTSSLHRQPVISVIGDRALSSLALMGISWVASGLIGFALGTVAAFHRDKPVDRVIRWLAYLQASVPTFWLGLIFLLVFAVSLGWFPIGIASPIGVAQRDVSLMDRLHHLALPALTLSVLGIANVTLHTREKMIDVLNSEYVLFARARGETELQILKNHVLRNAIAPAVTLHFSYFGELFGGSILAEQVFSYPGLGSTLTQAGLKGDIPLLLGIVLFSAVFVFVGNMLGEIINAAVNPRLRAGAEA